MLPENTMQAAKGRKQLVVLLNYNIYKPQQDNHKGEIKWHSHAGGNQWLST